MRARSPVLPICEGVFDDDDDAKEESSGESIDMLTIWTV